MVSFASLDWKLKHTQQGVRQTVVLSDTEVVNFSDFNVGIKGAKS